MEKTQRGSVGLCAACMEKIQRGSVGLCAACMEKTQRGSVQWQTVNLWRKDNIVWIQAQE